MTDTSDRLAEIRARLDAAKGISPGTNLAEKFGLAVSAGYAIRDNAADDLAFLLELVDQLQQEYRELAEELGTDLAEESLPLAFSDRKRLLGEVDRLRAENARLAAQNRASGPETPQGHPSEGTGVRDPHARSETHIDTIARILVGTDWDEEIPCTDIGDRETVARLAGQIATVLAPAHYRDAAASLRALGHDTAADLLDSTARDLTEGDTTE